MKKTSSFAESSPYSRLHFLAHRGQWSQPAEKNLPAALRLALRSGFGIETDVRDLAGQLVVSHDPADTGALSAAEFFTSYREFGSTEPLALNVKADGLRSLLKPLLAGHAITNYFCFDMSVPETLAYRREGLRYFTRESEYEPAPALYADAAGVWMDMFHGDWITPADVRRHLAAGKQVALVSPELHGRPHLAFWARLREAGLHREPDLMLCTDFPVAARDFFHAQA